MTTKTYDQLATSADIQDADLIANWRDVGPLTTVTASQFRTYASGASLPLAGGTMTGALVSAVGSQSLPGLSFAGSTDTGLYRIGSANLGISTGGVKRIDISNTGTAITGTFSASGAATLSSTLAITGATTATGAIAANGGVDGVVGANTPAAGTFTTLSATGNTTLGDAGTDTLTINAAATFANRAAIFLTPAAGSSGYASIRLPHGAAPTTNITNGDVWSTTAGLFARINGATKTLAFTDSDITGNAATATKLATARTIGISGDLTWSSGSFDGSGNVTAAGTLATVNSNTGSFGSTSAVPVITVNGKGLITAVTTAALGTAAVKDTGTSGANVPLLNGANTYSGASTFSALVTLSAGATLTPATTPATTSVGYLGIPQNSQSGSYGLVMADAGKEVYVTATSTTTIPANGSVAFPIQTTIQVTAAVGVVVTLAITTDTLRWIPSSTTGSRTITGPGYAVIQKKTATEWWVTGVGVT